MEHEFCGKSDCDICFPKRTTLALHEEQVDLIIDLAITADTLKSYLIYGKARGYELPPMTPGNFQTLQDALWHIKNHLQFVENSF